MKKIDAKKAPKLAALQAKLDKAGVKYTVEGSPSHPSLVRIDRYELANSLVMPGIGEKFNPNNKRIREAIQQVKK